MCELWRALLETGAIQLAGGAIRIHRAPEALGSPEGVREVVSQRLSRLAPVTVDLLELGATAGTAFELEVVRRASGLADAELLPALDEAVRSGMIDEVPSAGWRGGSPTSSCAARSTTGSPGRGGRSCTCGSERRWRRRPRSGRSLADLAHHFAAAAPFGERRARRRVQRSAPRAPPATRSRSRTRRPACAPRSRSARPARAELMLELGQAEHRAGHAPEALEAFRRPRRSRREQRRRGAARPRGDRLRRGVLAAGHADHGAVELLEEAATRSAARTRSCASACSAGWRARATCRAGTSARDVARTARSRWRAGSATTPGSPRA